MYEFLRIFPLFRRNPKVERVGPHSTLEVTVRREGVHGWYYIFEGEKQYLCREGMNLIFPKTRRVQGPRCFRLTVRTRPFWGAVRCIYYDRHLLRMGPFTRYPEQLGFFTRMGFSSVFLALPACTMLSRLFGRTLPEMFQDKGIIIYLKLDETTEIPEAPHWVLRRKIG